MLAQILAILLLDQTVSVSFPVTLAEKVLPAKLSRAKALRRKMTATFIVEDLGAKARRTIQGASLQKLRSGHIGRW